ncbi:trypsin-like peptidase domain-containing protein [Olleya aquimaris]|uniref:Serine protease n=1 Tax=Olleya aquimaris TaxID=639310 RepID=A0A327RH93_9FLAO|nr:T9SS type A sorting domain-containing protein [Olleya aquimaris]RAJ16269.1 putative secreted protein (Por secretion system target) [Olleya aquimaris]
MIKKITLLTLALSINFSLLQAQDDGGLLKIADEFPVNASATLDYNSNNSGMVYQKEFRSTGSGYVKVHFKNFDLKPGDFVKVYSPITLDEIIYTNQGKVIGTQNEMISNFWSRTIWSDHIIVELYSAQGNNTHYGFDIDTVAYGYSMDKINNAFQYVQSDFETICSVDDKEAIVCYDGTEMGRKAEAVCRLLIGGGGLCTGWLLGTEGNIMTNNHCIGDAADALNTEFLFNYQYSDCVGITDDIFDLVATTSTFIQTDANLDFTLVMLPVNPVATYGYLSLASNPPSVGERIYIPQHPGGRRKEIAVNTDTNGDANGFAQITNAGGLPSRVEYHCDTEGGSSGSPVLRYSDNLVVAIHNTGGCPNGSHGRSDELIAAIGANMPNGGVDDPNPITPSISFGNANIVVNEATGCDFQDIDFTLRMALPASQNADVTFLFQGGTATNNNDYELITPSTVTFVAGDNTDKTGTIRVYNDAFVEGEETIVLELALNANGGDAELGFQDTLTVSIKDDDYDPSVGNQINYAFDDFENTLSNWTVTGNATTPFAIGDATTASSGSWSAAGNATNFVFINDDACNCTMNNERLMYNTVFDLSSVSSASVTFDIIHTDSNNQYASDTYAQVSTDNGLTWVNLGNEFITYSTWTNLSLDLSAYTGQSSVMISFLYNDLGNWAYGFAIDNFSVDGNGNALIQTNTNDGTTSATLPLASAGTIYAYDAGDGSIMTDIINNDGTDYDCIDVAVSRSGTSGQSFQGSTGALLATDKQFTITTTQPSQSSDATITFYFTEAEVSGWETAVANAGGSFTRSDLRIYRESTSGTSETIVPTITDYNGNVKMTGNFTGIDGTYSFAPEQTLSVSDFKTNSFLLYPNPAGNNLTIEAKETIDKVSVYDINGRLINSVSLQNNQLKHQLDVTALSQGLYFIEIESENSKYVQKFIKR